LCPERIVGRLDERIRPQSIPAVAKQEVKDDSLAIRYVDFDHFPLTVIELFLRHLFGLVGRPIV